MSISRSDIDRRRLADWLRDEEKELFFARWNDLSYGNPQRTGYHKNVSPTSQRRTALGTPSG